MFSSVLYCAQAGQKAAALGQLLQATSLNMASIYLHIVDSSSAVYTFENRITPMMICCGAGFLVLEELLQFFHKLLFKITLLDQSYKISDGPKTEKTRSTRSPLYDDRTFVTLDWNQGVRWSSQMVDDGQDEAILFG